MKPLVYRNDGGTTKRPPIFGSMTWQAFISSDAQILGGKPALKGTRLSVEFLLERVAGGWSVQELCDNYPGLTPAHLQAFFAFAAPTCARPPGYSTSPHAYPFNDEAPTGGTVGA